MDTIVPRVILTTSDAGNCAIPNHDCAGPVWLDLVENDYPVFSLVQHSVSELRTGLLDLNLM
ncbi:hypothetical protein N7513_009184 [Penicillium frequentans]|nr:hypothetical protein N7513_009184 [Penicillium glabrum]